MTCACGDIVVATDINGHDVFGRVVHIGGGGLTEIWQDDGRFRFVYSRSPIELVQVFDGPKDAIEHLGGDHYRMRFSVLEQPTRPESYELWFGERGDV